MERDIIEELLVSVKHFQEEKPKLRDVIAQGNVENFTIKLRLFHSIERDTFFVSTYLEDPLLKIAVSQDFKDLKDAVHYFKTLVEKYNLEILRLWQSREHREAGEILEDR